MIGILKLFCRYEVLAIQQALIRRMAMEASESKGGVYEVEMSETRPRLSSTGPATP